MMEKLKEEKLEKVGLRPFGPVPVGDRRRADLARARMRALV